MLRDHAPRARADLRVLDPEHVGPADEEADRPDDDGAGHDQDEVVKTADRVSDERLARIAKWRSIEGEPLQGALVAMEVIELRAEVARLRTRELSLDASLAEQECEVAALNAEVSRLREERDRFKAALMSATLFERDDNSGNFEQSA